MRGLPIATGLLLLAEAAAAPAVPARPRSHAPDAAACSMISVGEDRVFSVTSRGEIALASGRLARLAGVRLATEADGAPSPAVVAALAPRIGSKVQVSAAPDAGLDRWGRLAATITVIEADPPLDLAGTLVEAGLAFVDAGEDDTFCRPGLLLVEDGARRGAKGLWGIPDRSPGPIPAEDSAQLNAVLGRFVLVEGRIHAVGERQRRTYLDFGPFGRNALSITIPKGAWRRMVERGLSAPALRGRSIRARGILETWRGAPTIEVAVPETIELLGEAGDERRQ